MSVFIEAHTYCSCWNTITVSLMWNRKCSAKQKATRFNASWSFQGTNASTIVCWNIYISDEFVQQLCTWQGKTKVSERPNTCMFSWDGNIFLSTNSLKSFPQGPDSSIVYLKPVHENLSKSEFTSKESVTHRRPHLTADLPITCPPSTCRFSCSVTPASTCLKRLAYFCLQSSVVSICIRHFTASAMRSINSKWTLFFFFFCLCMFLFNLLKLSKEIKQELGRHIIFWAKRKRHSCLCSVCFIRPHSGTLMSSLCHYISRQEAHGCLPFLPNGTLSDPEILAGEN